MTICLFFNNQLGGGIVLRTVFLGTIFFVLVGDFVLDLKSVLV